MSKHDNEPTNEQIKAVCIELNQIFPCLKYDPHDDKDIVRNIIIFEVIVLNSHHLTLSLYFPFSLSCMIRKKAKNFFTTNSKTIELPERQRKTRKEMKTRLNARQMIKTL